MHLHHSPTCPFSRRVRFALELGQVPYDETVIHWEAGVPEEYKQLNAAGTVPTLQDDGRVLTDSADILEHLAPQVGYEVTDKDQRRAGTITREVLKPAKAMQEDPSKRDAWEAGLDEVESWFDGPYLGGTTPGYLDIVLSSAIAAESLGVDVGDRPHLSAWQDAIRAMPAFQAVPEEY